MDTIRNADVFAPAEPSLKTRVSSRADSIRRSMSEKLSTVGSKMNAARRNPAVITGVASGVAIAAGIAGRMLRRRMHPVRQPAGFILIEAC